VYLTFRAGPQNEQAGSSPRVGASRSALKAAALSRPTRRTRRILDAYGSKIETLMDRFDIAEGVTAGQPADASMFARTAHPIDRAD